MAKKEIKQYVCQNCGAVYPKWQGKCDACGEWNDIVEEIVGGGGFSNFNPKKSKGHEIEFVSLSGAQEQLDRLTTGINELDRVCGGGLVSGSVILVGGDPGIGKSTLLLQACAKVADLPIKPEVYYISGEEAIDQVRLRAKRLGLEKSPVNLASCTEIKDIITTLEKANASVVVIDSIQTMYLDEVESTPGSVTQVRACSYELIKLAKRKGFTLFLVGHVTKQGEIAGPRVLEHMVDTVLYFEGERGHHFRILRAVKNRYGATDEIGVFEMQDKGLVEVANPSALFLAERQGNISGSCVFAGVEGSRPVLVEIQALVSPTGYASPKRAVVGWDSNRLAMVLAVLEARCGMNLSSQDVYLNIAGGLRISEPAADLAVALAVISSLTNKPLPADMVVFGEIGLSGEVRAVSQPSLRLKEAKKLGFNSAIIPSGRSTDKKFSVEMSFHEIGNVQRLINLFN
ncbi:MAG: DNA repair protein RadA [bacterium]|nr:DNA repair protein RadA [bacterium]MDY2830386.1 DNA repair protein RadA [Alphaproteobacteria bacterium]